MQKRSLLFLLTFVCITTATTYTYPKKNSIRIHPVNLATFLFEDNEYFFEIDYTRSFPQEWDLIFRVSQFKVDPTLWGDWNDRNGRQKETEIEVGARKLFHLKQSRSSRFSLFPQATIVGGHIDYYRDDYIEIEEYEYELVKTVDYSGYMAKIFAGGGLQFSARRFVLSLDCSLGLGLYVPSEDERYNIEPNFTVGYTF